MTDHIKSKYSILFIDDEEKSVKYFKKLFGNHFKIIATTQPSDVLKIIDERPGEIAVVVSDQRMPSASGVDLLANIKKKNHNIVRVLTTAYASLENNIAAINKGNVFAYLSKPWDIEEVKAALNRALAEFESRQNYISLSGSIAHEMRNPLGSVRQSTQLIKEKLSFAHLKEKSCCDDEEKITPLTKSEFDEIIESLNIADSSAQRGNAIIDIILNNISGKPANMGNFVNLKASSIVNKVMVEYAFKNGEKDKVDIDIIEPHDFLIRCDETSLMYVFFNLIKNSLYYSQSKADFHIKIRTQEQADSNKIYVYDNGPGIAHDKLDSLFGAFNTSGKVDGTGLGLSFCKKSMQSIGGDITCHSKEGYFTEFTLSFPKTSTQTTESFVNKILLVDDEETNLLIIKALLEKRLYSTKCDKVKSGQEAIKMVQDNEYNVILMDIKMPDMNGINTVKEIRKFNSQVPIIAYSAKDLELVIDDLKSSGFNGYVSKTSSKMALLRMVSKWGIVNLITNLLKDKTATQALHKKRVLLADDEEINLLITSKYLSKYQIELDKARDGSEVLELVEKNQYDLILMDIQMPKMDGLKTIRELKKLKQHNNLHKTPIIAITGDNNKNQIRKLLDAGFDDYFIKGDDYNSLSEIMEFWGSNDVDDNLFISLPTSKVKEN